MILRNTENNYELFGYSRAPLTNKERLNERGKAKPVFTWQVNIAIDPRSVTQCNIVNWTLYILKLFILNQEVIGYS